MLDEAIDLRGYIDIFLRRWWLLLLVTLLALLASFAYSLQRPSVISVPIASYEANSVVHLEGVEGLASIPELAESRPVLEDVITDLNLSLTVEELRTRVRVSRIVSSSLVRITVSDSDPDVATSIADGVAQSFIDYIGLVRESSLTSALEEELKLLSYLDVTSTDQIIAQTLSNLGSVVERPYIISPAEAIDVSDSGAVSAAPGSNISRNLVLALFLGVLLSVVLIIGLEYIQNPIRSSAQFDRKFTLTRLGTWPVWRRRRNLPYPLPVIDDTTSGVAEAIRQVSTSVTGVIGKSGIKTLALVSPDTRDGRSSVVANLGVALAKGWKNVVLIDGDLRGPSLHRYFDVENNVGLSSFLTEPDLSVDQIVQETSYQRLKIVPSGPIPGNPVELLSSPRMQWLIDYLKDIADIVLVDTPPLLEVTDGVVVSAQVESVVLLVNGANCRTETIRTATSYLEKVGAPILGYIWNGRNSSVFWNYSQSGRYHWGLGKRNYLAY